METKRPTKAKRKLSEIDFSHEGGHVALVSKDQGGGANGHNYALVMKATKFSDEFIEKAQQVRVTMELPEFLSKFFGLYYQDADILARMMGYKPPVVEQTDYVQEHEDWIQSKLQSFEILKSAFEAEDISEVISELDEDQYMALLKDQLLIEKALKKIDKEQKQVTKQVTVKESDNVVNATESDNSTNAGVEKSVEPSGSELEVKKETTMTKETQVIEKEVEVVEKAQFELVQKALEEQKVALEKAMETISQLEAEKKANIVKAKTAQISAVLNESAHKDIIIKASLSLESEDDFTAFVAAVQAMMTTVEKSEMFVEKGATVETQELTKTSSVAKILKAQLEKNSK